LTFLKETQLRSKGLKTLNLKMLEILDEALKMDKSAKDNKEIYSELN
jgi:hypothetical protein